MILNNPLPVMIEVAEQLTVESRCVPPRPDITKVSGVTA
jgi:hypothetical protein